MSKKSTQSGTTYEYIQNIQTLYSNQCVQRKGKN